VIEQRSPLLLRLKLLLRVVHPAVWRRVKFADSLSMADLHRVIQLLMAWDDDHLHRFRIHGRDYGTTYAGGPSFDEDAAAVRLGPKPCTHQPRVRRAGRATGGCRLTDRST
jgi:hypothetical protein